MKLIINLPDTKNGWNLFNTQFAKLQTKLIIDSIMSLNISHESKIKVLYGVLKELENKI